jgi:hypothetical protein
MTMREVFVPDDLEGFLAQICPLREPSDELMRWLGLLMPVDAPTVPVLGTDGRSEGIGHVPPIEALSPHHLPVFPTERRRVIADVLPAGVPRLPSRQAPREGIRRWSMESAFFRDIRGCSTAQIADMLDLTDDSTRASEGGSRSARRYVAQGRAILAQLGAWPWCLAENGRLEKRWWTIERYAGAILVWHERACVEASEATVLAMRAVITTPTWRSAEFDARARELYREQLRDALAAASVQPKP